MKKNITFFIKTVFVLMTVCCVQNATAQSFTNPVGDLSDPYINYIDGYYYYTGTVGNRIAIKRATTLEGLKFIGLTTVFGPASINGQQGHYWSSEIHKFDGKWYIYYTAASVGDDSSTQRNFAIECSDANPITGSWTFKGKVYDTNLDFFSINPSVAEINGVRYFLWSGTASATGGTLNIYMAAMSNPWTLSGSATKIYTSGDLSGTQNGEAPSILVKNNKVFLAYTANGCGSEDGKIGLMYMDNDTSNPLTLSSWTQLPDAVFDDNATISSYNPNHLSFFTSPDGTQTWISYTARFDNGGWCDGHRSTRAQQISFDSNGIPQFGTITNLGTPKAAPSGEPSLPAGTIVDNGLYRIRPKAATGTETLEIAGIHIWGGGNVAQWTDDYDEIHHKWYLRATDVADEYLIISAFNGLAVEVGACLTDDYANINTWYPNGADCQKWILTSLGSGDYRLTNKNSGKVIELENGGNNIHQNTLSKTSDYQKFKLEFIQATLSNHTVAGLNNTVRLYPNPAQEYFIIDGMVGGETKSIIIRDVLGKNIVNQEVNDTQYKINSTKLSPGLYIVSVLSNGSNILNKKIIVK